MTKIEALAAELAFLSNDSVHLLAEILIRDYPTRVDVLEQAVRVAQRESIDQILSELGVSDA